MTKEKIIKLEEELRLAMISSDVAKLNELIDDSLVFISSQGVVCSKEMDLKAHENKIQKITELNQAEQSIQINENNAVVTVLASLKGEYASFDISGDYRYLRIWGKVNNTYKIIAGSVTKLSN